MLEFRLTVFKEDIMKKRFGVALVLSMAMVLGACGAKQQAESVKGTEQKGTEASTAAKEESKEADSKADAGDGKTYKVGILKFMDHPSLNQIEDSLCTELDSLSKDGVKYEYKEYKLNGQGDASVLNQMTAQLLADKVDVIVPIATPGSAVRYRRKKCSHRFLRSIGSGFRKACKVHGRAGRYDYRNFRLFEYGCHYEFDFCGK